MDRILGKANNFGLGRWLPQPPHQILRPQVRVSLQHLQRLVARDRREVIKVAISSNAAALILVHNHPSGDPSPSEADKSLTARLREALALVDVRTLDHIIVAGSQALSFADLGLL